MDPLSITGAIIALCSTLSNITKAIRALRSASSEMGSLVNEVSDFALVIQQVDLLFSEKHCRDQDDEAGVYVRLKDALEHAAKKLDEIEAVIGSSINRPTRTSVTEAIRTTLPLLRGPKVIRLKNELHNVKLSVQLILTVLMAHKSSQIELDLQSITHLISDPERRILETVETMELTEISPLGTQLVNSIIQQSGSDRSVSEGAATPSTSAGSSSGVDNGANEFMVRVSPRWGRSCGFGCACSCHGRRGFQSPLLLRQIVGCLFVGFSGTILPWASCDTLSCLRQGRLNMTVQYSFPQWFLQRAVFLALQNSSVFGPNMQLRVPRVVWDQAEIFWHSLNGNTEGIKQLVSSGLASPNDVAVTDNYTALLYALINRHLDTCRLLIEAGADPDIEPDIRGSPKEYAWDLIMGKNMKTSDIDELRCLFPYEDYAEDQSFSNLHLIVLGLKDGNLEVEALASQEAIDATDARGRTALWWASRRGDIETVKVLLRNGASTEIVDEQGLSALYASTYANTPACLELLLLHGATISPNKLGWDPLHYAAAMCNDPGFVELLLRFAATPDSITIFGDTPFTMASQWGKFDNMKLLLAAGASIDGNDPTVYHMSPLQSAVQSCEVGIVLFLLEHGANCTLFTREGQNILHGVAIYGDVSMMESLCKLSLRGVDASHKDNFGMTPVAYLLRRPDTNGLHRAFYNLFHSIKEAEIAAAMSVL